MVIAPEHGGYVVFYHTDRTLRMRRTFFFPLVILTTQHHLHSISFVCQILLNWQNVSCRQSILDAWIKAQSQRKSITYGEEMAWELLVWSSIFKDQNEDVSVTSAVALPLLVARSCLRRETLTSLYSLRGGKIYQLKMSRKWNHQSVFGFWFWKKWENCKRINKEDE